MKKISESKRYVKLQKPGNKRYLVIVFTVVAALIAIMTSNYWLPDTRANLTTYTEGKIYTFSSSSMEVERVAYNPSNQIGEIRFKETVTNAFTRNEFVYKVVDSKGRELPSGVIESDYQSKSTDNKTGVYWSIVQFKVEPNYEAVTFVISEADYADRTVSFDARDIKQVPLIEKGKDYLSNMVQMFYEIDVLETQVETRERYLKDMKPDINVAKSELDLADDTNREARQKAYDDIIAQQTLYQKEYDELQTQLKEHQKILDDWNNQ